MGEVIHLPRPKVPHVMVSYGGSYTLIPLSDIKGLASGDLSIAEFEDPEAIASLLAIICMSYLGEDI